MFNKLTYMLLLQEVDVYIENIIAKFGSFHYAPLRTPFNPQMVDQHLVDMIPGLRANNRGRRRSSTAKSDLTLKIVKTADNNLSVVKKDQIAKESPQIKRTIDITGEGAISRTPTPPSITIRRKTTTARSNNRSKSTIRHSEGNIPSIETVAQVLRRKSMAVEKLAADKMGALAYKRKMSTLLDETKTPTVVLTRSDEKIVQSTSTNDKSKNDSDNSTKMSQKPNLQIRKRKISNEKLPNEGNEENEAPVKITKVDKNRSIPVVAEKVVEQTEAEPEKDQNSFLGSVGLMKRGLISKPKESGSNKLATAKNVPKDRISSSAGQNKNKINDKTQPIHIDINNHDHIFVSEDSPSFNLVPFIELKEEPRDEEINANSTREQTPEPTQTPSFAISSNETTPIAKNQEPSVSVDNLKTETSSDDEGLMIVDNDSTDKTKKSNKITKSPPGIARLIDNIRRGAISVRDINKLTITEAANQLAKPALTDISPKARKTFPSSSTAASTSLLRSRNNASKNKTSQISSMVCIPMDGNRLPLTHFDIGYSSTQPPPLTIVGSSTTVPTFPQSTPSNASTSSSSSSSNGPPPLSLTTKPSTLSNLPQSNSISTSSTTDQKSSNTNSLPSIANGMLTDGLASAVTDMIVQGPPKLVARPQAPLRSDGSGICPIEGGSVNKKLADNAYKIADFFRSVIEDTLSDLANTTCPEAKVRLLEIEVEKLQSQHAKEMADLKSNTDRILAEMKKSMEKERQRAINEVRKQCEIERIRAVDETKKKQWCTSCGKEAQFYCCWNTSYCDYACQRKHW